MLKELEKITKKIRYKTSMRELTSFKIGGSADVLVDVQNINELKSVIVYANRQKIPIFFLGAGSNILVTDKGIRGITVRMTGELKDFKIDSNIVYAGAGAFLPRIAKETAKIGLTGLEFGIGIPGTIGGSIIMNAGIKEYEIGTIVEEILIINKKGNEEKIKNNKIQFKYRRSNIKNLSLALTYAKLKLRKAKTEKCNAKLREFIKERKKQPKLPSAGCIFKNPSVPTGRLSASQGSASGTPSAPYRAPSAGKLIEICGFKGERIGDIQVSHEHANFFVNLGDGKASQVIKLIQKVKNKVKKQTGIELKEEIIIVGEK